MYIHPQAACLIQRLEACGHEAYVVGGCVRDALLGQIPHDWDLCTSATPEEAMACFAGLQVLPTGLAHGTVTVVLGGEPFEVTTFRTEEEYLDNRHPSGVHFVTNLTEDLARRDFTINAMAYSPAAGLADPFGGKADLGAKRLSSVGNPAQRFADDGLRILRALRFAARLGFSIDPALDSALHACKDLLQNISAERLFSELCGLLQGQSAGALLREYPDVLGVFVPEILPMVGFAQHSPHHTLDVWAHTTAVVDAARPQRELRLAALFHDVAKPACFTLDEKGVGHFYGHEGKGADMADDILRRLRADNATRDAVCELIRWHDADIHPAALPRWLARLGPQRLRQLLHLKRADAAGQAQSLRETKNQRLNELEAALQTLLEQKICFSLADLAVNGSDALAAGIPPGPPVGEALNTLLDGVLDGRLDNTREALLATLRKLKTSQNGENSV